MLKIFTQCPHFKRRIKHLAFLLSLIFFTIGLIALFMLILEIEDDTMLGIFFIPISLFVFFYPWKVNYLKRNKN